MTKTKPAKWPDVYAYGTREGDEEAKVFKALARDPKFTWRSVAAIAKQTGLPKERVEEIIDKYVNKINPPLIYPSPTNEDHWAYWEREPSVLDEDDRNISQKDRDQRIDKHLAGNSLVGSKAGDPNVVADKTNDWF